MSEGILREKRAGEETKKGGDKQKGRAKPCTGMTSHEANEWCKKSLRYCRGGLVLVRK